MFYRPHHTSSLRGGTEGGEGEGDDDVLFFSLGWSVCGWCSRSNALWDTGGMFSAGCRTRCLFSGRPHVGLSFRDFLMVRVPDKVLFSWT